MKISHILMALTLVVFVGCQNKVKHEDVSLNGVSTQSPQFYDEEKGTLTILARVNGKYFDNPTRHLLVFGGGKFGDKSIFQSVANQNDFYNGLIIMGAKAGNNMNSKNAETTQVEGSKLDIKVAWEGSRVYDISELVIDSNNKELDFRFGGNQNAAKEKNTGCLTCLDSCPVGIVSNHTYAYGAVEKQKEVEFYGNKKLLPKDGTYITLTYSIKPD
ncbi:MAG: YdjY domain-containing protein [Campylobacter sp.]|nr:YdjY domain-containing protein [Campylobacter sp.]